MTPKTKQEAYRLIDQKRTEIIDLQTIVARLPDEARPVTEGWDIIAPGVLCRVDLCRVDQGGLHYTVATVKRNGLFLSRLAQPALDGIAHDDKGRIKVVGYVNAEDLRLSVEASGYDVIGNPRLFEIIDELAG